MSVTLSVVHRLVDKHGWQVGKVSRVSNQEDNFVVRQFKKDLVLL